MISTTGDLPPHRQPRVKGRLKIADDDDGFSVTKLSAPADRAGR
jgi:hypothetical protein